METLLIILGLFVAFFVLKFIYDSYLTNNTNEKWSEYRRVNPEEAARIENNKGLNLNTKQRTNESDRKESLLRLATSTNCPIHKLKETYFNTLKNECNTIKEINDKILNLREVKYEESRIYNIDPDDTSVAILETWTREYLNEIKGGSKNEVVQLMKLFTEEEKNDIIDKAIEKSFGGKDLTDEQRAQNMINKLHEYDSQFEINNEQLKKIERYYKYVVYNAWSDIHKNQQTIISESNLVEWENLFLMKLVHVDNDLIISQQIHKKASDYFNALEENEMSIFSPLRDEWDNKRKEVAKIINRLK